MNSVLLIENPFVQEEKLEQESGNVNENKIGASSGYFFMCTSGCATYKTLEVTTTNSPKVFSGTRLDLNAIQKNNVALRKFNVSPPKYPLVDLQASFMLDMVVLPATGAMSIYEAIID